LVLSLLLLLLQLLLIPMLLLEQGLLLKQLAIPHALTLQQHLTTDVMCRFSRVCSSRRHVCGGCMRSAGRFELNS
jgi:hypothetical protein